MPDKSASDLFGIGFLLATIVLPALLFVAITILVLFKIKKGSRKGIRGSLWNWAWLAGIVLTFVTMLLVEDHVGGLILGSGDLRGWPLRVGVSGSAVLFGPIVFVLVVGFLLSAVYLLAFRPLYFEGIQALRVADLGFSAHFALIWLSAVFFPEFITRQVGWGGVIVWAGFIGLVFGISFLSMFPHS